MITGDTGRKILRKYKDMSAVAKTSIWFTLCNFLQRGTAIITVPIFTRLLTTKQYGLYSVYLSWFEIFILFTSLKIPYEGLNNGLIRHEEDKDGYTSSVAGLMLVMTVFWGILYLIFRKWIDAATGFSGFVMIFMFFELLLNPPLFLWTNRERFDFRYRIPVIVTMISTVLSPTIAIIAVLNTTYKAEARIMATSLTQGIFGILLLTVLFRKGRTFYNKEYWKFAFCFNLPLVFFYMSQTILNQADRIMINYYTGTGDAGIYSVAYSAATLVQIMVSAVNGSFNPWMYKKIKHKEAGEIKRIASMLLLLVAGATSAMMLLAPDLVRLLATEEYYQAIWVIPPVSASVFFIFLYLMFANVEMYYGENKYIAVISIIAALSNVVLNAIFIPMFGYLAAGWTTVFCYMLLTVMHFCMCKRALRMHQVTEPLFAEKEFLLIILLEMAIMFTMLWVYTLGYYRYLIILLGAVLVLVFRKRLLHLWKTLKQKDEK